MILTFWTIGYWGSKIGIKMFCKVYPFSLADLERLRGTSGEAKAPQSLSQASLQLRHGPCQAAPPVQARCSEEGPPLQVMAAAGATKACWRLQGCWHCNALEDLISHSISQFILSVWHQ